MKRILAFFVLLFCMAAPAEAKSRLINIWIPKEAFSDATVPICVNPDDLSVTRCALYPWDEEKTKFSLFAEVENTSKEKIVIDETWLYAADKNKETIAVLPYIFRIADSVISPGERVLLHAGVVPYRKADSKAPEGYVSIAGMEDFARQIDRAAMLRIRLEVRGEESKANWVHLDGNSRAEVRSDKIVLTVDESEDIRMVTCQAVLSDKNGRILDVFQLNTLQYYDEQGIGRQEVCEGPLVLEKPLAPYLTDGMLEGAVLDVQIIQQNKALK